MSREDNNILSPGQCRAARALLHINQIELAKAAEVGTKTVADFERETGRELNIVTLRALRAALERKGIQFIDANGGGPGVRLKKKK
ncbi:MAG TPA: transcriptional regulator [Dongiaceae bacterium]|jgi:DNA-binding XRE family transcriptional regulator|nr:transcriptional regulator [Dongiaceae bacterium]